MNREETKLIVAGLLELSDIAERLDALHKYLTDFLLQKGAPHVEDANDFDYGRN